MHNPGDKQRAFPDIIKNVDFSEFEESVASDKNLCSTSFLCATAKFFFSRLFIVILVLAPIYAPFVYFRASGHNHSSGVGHVYFNPGGARNHTVVVRCAKLNPFQKEVVGISKTITDDGIVQRAPLIAALPQAESSYLLAVESEGYVGIVDRRAWEENSKQILADIAPVAVVIKDCDPFRPSSPLPKNLADGADVPVVLVRIEDSWAMPSSDLLIIGVTPRQTTAPIPDPSWKCESEGCLDPVFVDGYIEGNQYRTKCCIFGNETCPSDDDDDDDDDIVETEDAYGLQHEPFCNGPSTEVCPLAAGADFGDWRQFDIGGESRSLRYFRV